MARTKSGSLLIKEQLKDIIIFISSICLSDTTNNIRVLKKKCTLLLHFLLRLIKISGAYCPGDLPSTKRKKRGSPTILHARRCPSGRSPEVCIAYATLQCCSPCSSPIARYRKAKDWTRDDPNHHEPGSQRKRPRRAGSDDQRLDPRPAATTREPIDRNKSDRRPQSPLYPCAPLRHRLPCSRPFRLR
jgi:hypothetical protein